MRENVSVSSGNPCLCLLQLSSATSEGADHSLQASPPLNRGQTLAASRRDIAVSPLCSEGREDLRASKQAGLSLTAPQTLMLHSPLRDGSSIIDDQC